VHIPIPLYQVSCSSTCSTHSIITYNRFNITIRSYTTPFAWWVVHQSRGTNSVKLASVWLKHVPEWPRLVFQNSSTRKSPMAHFWNLKVCPHTFEIWKCAFTSDLMWTIHLGSSVSVPWVLGRYNRQPRISTVSCHQCLDEECLLPYNISCPMSIVSLL